MGGRDQRGSDYCDPGCVVAWTWVAVTFLEGDMKFLSDEQLSELLPAETSSFPSPVPTQIVSSDEYMPVPQTEKQREIEARLKEMSDRLARRQGMSRRRFFQTASGMAASFLVMNQVFGPLFEVSEAEAATPDMATELPDELSKKFIL